MWSEDVLGDFGSKKSIAAIACHTSANNLGEAFAFDAIHDVKSQEPGQRRDSS